jgi:hypothetical protein
MSYNSKVFGSISLSNTAFILSESNIKTPMQRIFNTPVFSLSIKDLLEEIEVIKGKNGWAG